MDIKFCDLHKQYLLLKDKIDQNINEVLSHGQFINGPQVRELEGVISKYLDAAEVVGVSSGTDALLISLMALDLNPGDFVITTPFTFIATAEVISLLRAIPIFVDIEEDSFNISVSKLEEFLSNPYHPYFDQKIDLKKVKAVIGVDLFGQVADYQGIKKVLNNYDIAVIQDAAQSFGAEYKNQKSCLQADIACTSFFPSKPLGCFGDGGAIITKQTLLADKVRKIKDHGQNERYNHQFLGINGRLDTLQAAVLLAKFEHFCSKEINLRSKVADRYLSNLKILEENKKLILPKVMSFNKSIWAQFSLRILNNQRDKVINYLKSQNIPWSIHYPKPLHLQEVFTDLNYKLGSFPVSEKVSSEILSLPMHPYLDQEIDYISDKFKDFFL